MKHGKKECYRHDYEAKRKGTIDIPAEKGGKGIPSNMPGSIGNSGPKIDVPGEKGDKGAKLASLPKKAGAPLD